MKAPLVVMLLFTLLVAGATMAYKSAQSLMFIKPGSGFSLSSLGISTSAQSSGKGIWAYDAAKGSWSQETGTNKNSLASLRVFQFLQDPQNTQIVYAATDAGPYRYDAANNSWTYLAGGLPAHTQAFSVSADAKDSSRLFISTAEDNGTNAIWRSQDRGTLFTQVYTAAQGEKIVDVIDDWYNPQRVIALNDKGSVLRSDDGGTSWRVVSSLGYADASHLFMDPNDSRILYALQPQVGILKSIDSGSSWQSEAQAFSALPISAKIINDMRFVPNSPQRLYCATNYGILRSENGGKSFMLVHSLVAPDSTPIETIALGKNSQVIFMSAGNALYESHDAGNTWALHVLPGNQTIDKIFYFAPADKIITALRGS